METAARHLRYTFLWQVADKVGADKIAVGHHGDDQVETVLMHLLRGSGSRGLQGMSPMVSIGDLALMQTPFSATSPQLMPSVIR
ncbi:MAG: ATP-binding protein, partial [Pseudomonadota bacterium]